jgi:hypothetical protein
MKQMGQPDDLPKHIRFAVVAVRTPNSLMHRIEVEVTLRPTVSRPVRLPVRHPSGTCDQFFFLLDIFFRQLRVCYFVTPSLTRGRVCNLLLLLGLASAVTLGVPSLIRGQVCLLASFCSNRIVNSTPDIIKVKT